MFFRHHSSFEISCRLRFAFMQITLALLRSCGLSLGIGSNVPLPWVRSRTYSCWKGFRIIEWLARLPTRHTASGVWIVVLCALGAAAEQPIAFPHNTHMQLGMQCVDCHIGADHRDNAGIPSVRNACSVTPSWEKKNRKCKKSLAYAKKNTEIPWVRVYGFSADAHVKFRHAPHYQAGISCSTCHGDLTKATVAERTVIITWAPASLATAKSTHRRTARHAISRSDRGRSESALANGSSQFLQNRFDGFRRMATNACGKKSDALIPLLVPNHEIAPGRGTVASGRLHGLRRGMRHYRARHGRRAHGRTQRREVSRAHRLCEETGGESSRPRQRRPPLRARTGRSAIALQSGSRPRPDAENVSSRRCRDSLRSRGMRRIANLTDKLGRLTRRSQQNSFPDHDAFGFAVRQHSKFSGIASARRLRSPAPSQISHSREKLRHRFSAGTDYRDTISVMLVMRLESARISWVAGLLRSITPDNSATSAKDARASAASWSKPNPECP